MCLDRFKNAMANIMLLIVMFLENDGLSIMYI